MKTCIFCFENAIKTFPHIIHQTKHCYAAYDNYPISKGHLLIIPKNHYPSWIETPPEVLEDLSHTITLMQNYLTRRSHPDGFNIGVNIGKAAGQSIFHLHIHIIPRYHGDHPNPQGGIKTFLSSTS